MSRIFGALYMYNNVYVAIGTYLVTGIYIFKILVVNVFKCVFI